MYSYRILFSFFFFFNKRLTSRSFLFLVSVNKFSNRFFFILFIGQLKKANENVWTILDFNRNILQLGLETESLANIESVSFGKITFRDFPNCQVSQKVLKVRLFELIEHFQKDRYVYFFKGIKLIFNKR